MSYRPADVIEVRAWGRRVGAVALNPTSGWYAFAYDRDWVRGGIELAPLFMGLREQPYEFPRLRRETFYGLPPLLADSLPDKFGNALVDAWMAEQGVRPQDITPLDRLAYAADRAMGALEFRPPARDATAERPTAVQLADLVLAARGAVRGEFVDDEATHAALQQLISVGTSAGGARAKAVVAFNPTTFQIDSAYGAPVEGFEQWLIKLDGVSGSGMDGHGPDLGETTGYGRIEYAYSLMAGAAGIDMMPCQLLAEGPRRHFMTKRFERGPAGERLHVISLCGLAQLDYNLVGAHSYDQYLQSAKALGLGLDEIVEAFRRMVFNVMAVNNDDHTKNFAFLRGAEPEWRLSPAYDVMYAYNPNNQWISRHLMSVNGKFDHIDLDDIYQVGERNNVPGYRRVVREVRAAVERWADFAEESGVPGEDIKRIAAAHGQFAPR
ncbi:MAG TPA: type II toxin-antitoxin system HipA family toxin [Acidimicrobiales bacterium]